MPLYPIGPMIKLQRPVLPCVLAMALAGLGSSARAELRLCNQTDSRVGVAVGYYKANNWVTEGWWNVPPSACETLVPGPLDSRFYYYVHAVDYDRGGSWAGGEYMCTDDREFEIDGVEDCIARGYMRTGFSKVDIGNQTTWIIQLTESDSKDTGGQ